MEIEDRLKRLEELVSPEDQEGDITDAVMNLYGNFVHSLIWTGDFMFDLINSLEVMMTKIATLIPDEVVQQMKKMEDEESADVLRLVPDKESTEGLTPSP
jgi:hypothetical protein